MFEHTLPIGKLPPQLLADLIERLPTRSKEVLVGAWIGMHCAVVETSGQLLALKTDPLGAIASGALLIAVDPRQSQAVIQAVQKLGSTCHEIGIFVDEASGPVVRAGLSVQAAFMPRPVRD